MVNKVGNTGEVHDGPDATVEAKAIETGSKSVLAGGEAISEIRVPDSPLALPQGLIDELSRSNPDDSKIRELSVSMTLKAREGINTPKAKLTEIAAGIYLLLRTIFPPKDTDPKRVA